MTSQSWMNRVNSHLLVFPPYKAPGLTDCTNDPSSWHTVSKWIDECCSKHDTCREQLQSGWLPTKLVDISNYDNGYVRVVDSCTIPKDPGELYLALSHCWGRKAFRVMTEDSREEFREGVFFSSLSPNFQDAISVTRQLGFQYIWIDSLCIIQGSEEDWDHEAPLMNKVYRNAFLTLGAMASPHGYGGLFRSRDPEMTEPCPFKIISEEEGEMDCVLVNSNFWESEVRQAPLNQRAWVVQERILAPRSLYFGESQLFWECRQQHACELFPDGVPPAFIPDIKEPQAVGVVSVKAFETTIRRLLEAGSSTDNADQPSDDDEAPWVPRQYENPYQVWNDILEAYTRCALTKPGDKFVAISGIAKEFARAIDDEYLAGLWRKNLMNNLLWVAKDVLSPGISPQPVRPTPYRAPSWSWASLDAPDTNTQELGLHGEYAEVLGVRVVPWGDDPTGQLRHACLHLRGTLVRTRRRPEYRGGSGSFGKFIPDTEEMPGEKFYCLPLREWSFDGKTQLLGLVMAPCPGGDEAIWPSCSECSGEDRLVRVGTFRIDVGDPLKYLGMRKPSDWDDWGEESDHLWFSEDTPRSDLVVV